VRKIPRDAARDKGLKTFFNGVPCPKGHIGPRRVHRGDCLECATIAIRNWGVNNRARKLAVQAKYHTDNATYIKEWHADYRKELRLGAITAYGLVCACCDEPRLEFLTIDHVKGGGRKHRAEIGSQFYRWLRDNNYPKGFRTLCYNCNCSIGAYGYCPHDKERA
jgi:hypothetical protein